jgi:hypothetical protein
MATSSASGASAPATDPISALWTAIKAQALSDLAAPITAAANNIIATPSTQEAVLQGPALLTALVAIGPHLESQSLVDLATLIKGWAGTLPASTAPAA